MGRYKEAESLFRDAVETGKTHFKGEPFIATYLIWACFTAQLVTILPPSHCCKKLWIVEVKYNQNDTMVARVTNNLAVLFFQMGDYKKAEEM
jgi:hypothetical protein